MTYAQEREQTIAQLARVGVNIVLTRQLLRAATTLHRLAEAQCNGDYPYDNGQRKVETCARCEAGCVRSRMALVPIPRTLRSSAPRDYDLVCPDCRTQDRVRRILKGSGWLAQFQGDPRGCVLYIVPDDGQMSERYTGNHPKAIGIPGRY